MPVLKPEIGVELLQYQAIGPQQLYIDNSRCTFDDFAEDATPFTWALATSLTGNNRIFETAMTAGRPGVVTLRVGTSTAAAVSHVMQSLAAPNFRIPSGEWELLLCAQLAQLSDATNAFTFEFGALNQTAAQTVATAGAWFSYTHSVNGGNWTLNTGGAAQTSVDTGIPADLAWHEFSIRGNGVSTIAFYIDDVLVGTVNTANVLPTDSTDLTVHAPRMRKSAGAVTRDVLVDYFFLGWSVTSPR